MNDAPLPHVKTAQLNYVDYVCQMWQIERGPRQPERADPDAVRSDIYASTSAEERGRRFLRRRIRWPY